jgi:hypothetical protein
MAIAIAAIGIFAAKHNSTLYVFVWYGRLTLFLSPPPGLLGLPLAALLQPGKN